MTCFASQGRTHLDFVYAYAVDVFDRVFVEQRTSGYRRFLSLGVDDINRRYATKDPVTQELDDFAAFEQGVQDIAAFRSAIGFGNDQVLRPVDQPEGQIT